MVGSSEFEARGSVVRAGEARRLMISGKPLVLLDRLISHGGACVFEQVVRPHLLATPHTHANEDQFVYVLEGELGHRVGDDEYLIGPGSLVYKPRGIPHTVFNCSDNHARMLEVTFPATLQEYFDELDGIIRSGHRPSEEEVIEMASAYGLTFQHEWIEDLEERYPVKWAGSKR
jgi:uncharacterized cupin superfamily protein